METDDSKARARIRIACEECRKGKRKCDGQRPTCSLCQKSGRICLYASEASRKRKYHDDELIRSMQDEIDALKSALHKATNHADVFEPSSLIERSSSEHYGTSYTSQGGDNVSSEQSLPGHESVTDMRSPVAMEELASLMLKVQIEDRGEPSFTISSLEAKSRDSETIKPPTASLGGSSTVDIAGPQTAEYGNRQHLVGYFMQSFNTYHQFLDTEEAMALINGSDGLQDPDLSFRNNALFAVASCLSPEPNGLQSAEKYASTAEADVLRCIKYYPSDLVVQGIALLAWRDLMFGTHSMAYNWIAMATGQVLHLGLHVTALIKSFASSDLDRTLYRRRVRSFWAYFSVDRLVTSSLGMNCTMHWQRVKPPPFLSILFGEPTVDELAHERFCQLWHLWDSCMDQVYAFGWADLSRVEKENLVVRAHQALVTFNQNNDRKLQFHKDHMSETAVWLHLSYHTALILIHRPLLNEPKDSAAGRFSLQSATTASASISRIVRAFRKTKNVGSMAPQVIDYILTATVIHLLNATAGRTALGRQSANSIRTCVETLAEMQPKWGYRAQSAIKRIQELAHRWEVVWALPIQFSEPLPQTLQPPPGAGDPWKENFGSAGSTQDFNKLDRMALDTEVSNFWNSDPFPSVVGLDEANAYPIPTLDTSYLNWLFDSEASYEYEAITGTHLA